MSYETGFFKYIVKGFFKNFIPFYIFGAGFFAAIEALPHLADGNFLNTAITYFMTKYLPPTSAGQVISQGFVGTVAAGSKWYLKVPKRR